MFPEKLKIIENKDIIASIFRLQAYDSTMCGYFCIEFIDFMLNGKSLVDFTNLFSPRNFKKNDRIITKLFKISKYIVTFDYADKIFITISASLGTLSLVSQATIVGIPVGIAGSSLTLIFTVTTGIVKKMLNIKKEEKRRKSTIKLFH